MLATVTGIGSGTLRDVLLGAPVFWIKNPSDVVVCISVGVATCALGMLWQGFFSRLTLKHVLLWADAIGLAIFCIIGAGKAMQAGAHPFTAIVLGTLTASFGGIIRDILAGDVPLVLHREIYVTAAFTGAASFTVLVLLGLPPLAASAIGIACGFVLRALAILRNWSLPAFR